jgi:hypothetical protein
MIVYRLDWHSAVNGNRVEWFASRHRALWHGRKVAGAGNVVVTRTPLPRKKAEMLAWLNQNLRNCNV